MNLPTLLLIAGASWSILAISVGIPLGRGMKRADDMETEHVNWIPVLPPVPWPMKYPPVTQADIDAVWLDAWPTEVDEDELMNREFVSLIGEEWDWTEPTA